MKNLLLKLLGPTITVFFGDAACFDRFLWLKKNLNKNSRRTLDAGCGSGSFSFLAAKSGGEVLGMSFDSENNLKAAERAKIFGLNNAKFITENLNNLPNIENEIGKFDQIICFETIEHIINDSGLVASFSRILDNKGILLLTAPYKFYHHLYGDDQTGLSVVEDGGHVRVGYTHEELHSICKKFGLELVKTEYITGFFSQTLINISRFLNSFISNLGWLITFPLRPLILLDPLIFRLFKYPHLSVAIIARKN